MTTSLVGKLAVVTGASKGIGAASAVALAEAGADVMLTYHRDQAGGRATAERVRGLGRRAWLQQLDASEEPAVQRFASVVKDQMGCLHILCNNAGDMIRRAKLPEITFDLYRRIMDVNLWATIAVTKALLDLMPPGSVIVNMGSEAGRDGGGRGAGVYAAAKGAIMTLTRAWAKELGPRGIRVNCVAPGFIDTDFHRRYTGPEGKKRVAESAPAGKVGEAEDVARAVVYLAGEGGGFITGACLDINGGLSMV
jgi:3-oxoacyl-[acyl-carrier protein] reductase